MSCSFSMLWRGAVAAAVVVVGAGGCGHACGTSGCVARGPAANPPAVAAAASLPPDNSAARVLTPVTAYETMRPEDVLTAEGQLKRSALRRVLDAGPQAFIRRVRVRPRLEKNRFRGWEILAYQGPGRLLKGDVVLRINDRAIERPEQFMSVWEELGAQDQLTIAILRGGKPLTWRYRIVDDQGP